MVPFQTGMWTCSSAALGSGNGPFAMPTAATAATAGSATLLTVLPVCRPLAPQLSDSCRFIVSTKRCKEISLSLLLCLPLKTAAMPAGYGAVQGQSDAIKTCPALRHLSLPPDRSNARHGHGRRGAVRRHARCPTGGTASRPTNHGCSMWKGGVLNVRRVPHGDLLLGRLRCPARHRRPIAQTVVWLLCVCFASIERVPCLALLLLLLRCTVVRRSACLASGLGAGGRPGKRQGRTCLRDV